MGPHSAVVLMGKAAQGARPDEEGAAVTVMARRARERRRKRGVCIEVRGIVLGEEEGGKEKRGGEGGKRGDAGG